MKYTIEVTEEDIEKGVQRASCDCPVALALKRVFRLRKGKFAVWNHGVRATRFGYAPFPESAVKFIAKFDKGKSVKPFSFKLEI